MKYMKYMKYSSFKNSLKNLSNQNSTNTANSAIATTLKTKTLQIGVLAQRGVEQALQIWQPTAEYLSNQFSDYIFAIAPLSFEKIHGAIIFAEVFF
jgi:hypothetical protein